MCNVHAPLRLPPWLGIVYIYVLGQLLGNRASVQPRRQIHTTAATVSRMPNIPGSHLSHDFDTVAHVHHGTLALRQRPHLLAKGSRQHEILQFGCVHLHSITLTTALRMVRSVYPSTPLPAASHDSSEYSIESRSTC